jgi:DNA polymerase I-like protein with 3'-5' exonuclease and polymerase domains
VTAQPIVLDFETDAIAPRPHYPPEPVGLAIWDMEQPESEAAYYAWGHPSGNNASREYAAAQLHAAWQSGRPLLFHNAKFDVAVACEKLGLPPLPWQRVEDTMFLGYLAAPHARRIGLKELAEDLLGEAPDERDELRDWIWDHRRDLESTYGGKVLKSKYGAWISKAPGDLVGRYAIGDVTRTGHLWRHLRPLIEANGMEGAYDRERQCLPIFMENEREGMCVDMAPLGDDLEGYRNVLAYVEDWLRQRLKASGLNFDADADVASVLLAQGLVSAENWTKTASGVLSMAKDVLTPDMFTDAAVASALGYRNRLVTCVNMFMGPWYDQARVNGGRITTNWNQTYGENGGTRTGRPSTNKHNFLNISKDFEGRSDGYVHPHFLEVPALPLVRKYVLPDPGDVFIHRDFNSQEMRVFADLEQGDLHRQYLQNPAVDVHAFVGANIEGLTGRAFERTKVKILNFQALYGGGVPAAQRKIGCTYAEAKQYKAFHDKALPGRKIVVDEIRRRVRRGEPIRTWGGRLYYCEPPGPDGRSKDYKLINYYVQGSAADLTKQALVEWHADPDRTARFLVTVYDEINGSAAADQWQAQQQVLQRNMERDRLSVRMLSDGKVGPSWGKLEKCA